MEWTGSPSNSNGSLRVSIHRSPKRCVIAAQRTGRAPSGPAPASPSLLALQKVRERCGRVARAPDGDPTPMGVEPGCLDLVNELGYRLDQLHEGPVHVPRELLSVLLGKRMDEHHANLVGVQSPHGLFADHVAGGFA